MSNSKLVNYTKLSPNHSGKRTHSIDRITPHCVVGQVTIESLGSIFQPVSRQASSNYGIGADGRVGMFVEEKNRSWCSSSNANDQRAVTIECASDTFPPYAFKSVVYNKLVDLCVDICKRNGKKKLLFLGSLSKTESHVVKSDEMLLTAHRWFASTACPGEWMYSRLGNLAKTVTEKLGGKTPSVTPASPTSSVPNIFYRVKTKAHGWLPEVKNAADYAGVSGHPIIGVMIRIPDKKIRYRAHIKNGSWLPWVTGYSTKDTINGYAGDYREIDAVQMETLDKKFKVKYRVSPLRGNYYDWQTNIEKTGGQDGYAGTYRRSIDRFQAKIIKG